MANQNDSPSGAATERVTAPVSATPAFQVQTPPTARELPVERIGNQSSGMTYVFPEVRGGICEYCGVIDGNYPSQFQYKLCPHYRGKQLQCSYCPATKDADDVINHSIMRVLKHPTENKLIVYCDSYECKKKHEERWKLSN